MSSTQIQVGSIIAGKYRMVRALGGARGGRYEVAVADGRALCLKLFPAGLVRDPTLRQRFVEHVRASADVSSALIVPALDAGVEAGGLLWFVTELLSGQDLDALLKERSALSAVEAQSILSQVGEALAAAHAVGQVHGNLKPHNVFLASSAEGEPPRARLLNLGVARALSEAQLADGAAQGTPLWMAPEQATAGEAPQPSADVWAFGLLAYRLLTGQIYWREASRRPQSPMAIMREVTVDLLVPASERAREHSAAAMLPTGFDAWFAACVNRDVSARYRDATQAWRGLSDLFAGRAPALPRLSPVAPANPELATLQLGERGEGGRPPPAVRPPVRVSRRGPPRRRYRRVVAALLLLLLGLGAVGVVGWRRYQRQDQARLCDTPAAAQEDLQRRHHACQESCAAGAAGHCLQLGRLVLQHKLANELSAAEAARAYERACQLGELAGCRQLAMIYWEGNQGLKKDRALSIHLLLQACEGNDDAACVQLSEVDVKQITDGQDRARILSVLDMACQRSQVASCAQRGRLLLESKEPARAFEMLRRACDGGDALSCAQAGQLARTGEGTRKDLVQALAYFSRSCDREISAGCYWLGQLYAHGEGAKKELRRAADIYQQSCARKDAASCHELALMFLSGSGVNKDQHRGATLLTEACDLGHQESCAGVKLPEPRSERATAKEATASDAQARRLLEACRAGDGDSCLRLAMLYDRGKGIRRDLPRARALYQLACNFNIAEGCQSVSRLDGEGLFAGPAPDAFCSPEEGCVPGRPQDSRGRGHACGNSQSCLNLGHMYHRGQDVPRDLLRAADAFEQSCSLGNGEGCVQLGLMHERGEGVNRDAKRAAELYRKGCSFGNALACDRIKEFSGLPPVLYKL